MIEIVCAVLAVGGVAFYGLVAVAGVRFFGNPLPGGRGSDVVISLLKPLAGDEPGLEPNLRSCFEQDYEDFEVLFGVRDEVDTARPVAARLIGEYDKPAELLITGEPPAERYPNPKVYQLIALERRARGEILVISDSDIRAEPGLVRGIARDFEDPKVGVVTYPYRAVSGGGIWSLSEAVGMDTEFWGGVLVARMLFAMDFAVGPTMAVRQSCLREMGGFEAFREYAAEDFEIGRQARQKGWKVELSAHVVDHHIGSQRFLVNFGHRVRWYRQTRRSRPAGYVGQVFTYPVPFALALVAMNPSWAPLLGGVVIARLVAAAAVIKALGAAWGLARWALILPQDLASFVVWLLGFFGKSLNWRGRPYELTSDGRLRFLG